MKKRREKRRTMRTRRKGRKRERNDERKQEKKRVTLERSCRVRDSPPVIGKDFMAGRCSQRGYQVELFVHYQVVTRPLE